MSVLVISWFLAGIFVGAFLLTGLAVLFLRVKDKTPEEKLFVRWDPSKVAEIFKRWKTDSLKKYADPPIVADEEHAARVSREKMREGEVCPSCGMKRDGCQCRFEGQWDVKKKPESKEWR